MEVLKKMKGSMAGSIVGILSIILSHVFEELTGIPYVWFLTGVLIVVIVGIIGALLSSR